MLIRKISFIFLGCIIMVGNTACKKSEKSSGSKAAEVSLKSDLDKVSYSIGQQIGENFKNQGLEINIDALAAAIMDAMKGKESRLSKDEMQKAMANMQEKMKQKMVEAAEKSKAEGTKFLEENKKKEGVVTTKSGLQYSIEKAGSGESPKDESKVKVHYAGTLLDGTEFDSSYKRGEPVEFPVNGVIAGWTEALKLMKPGAKWKLVIPSELAYGSRGRPGIPANSVLNFTVELLEVTSK